MPNPSVRSSADADAQAEPFRAMLKEMSALFWDAQPDALDMERNSDYIIARLLNLGGMRGFIWVQRLYGEESIRGAVVRRTDMRPAVREFMARMYDIPRDDLRTATPWR